MIEWLEDHAKIWGSRAERMTFFDTRFKGIYRCVWGGVVTCAIGCLCTLALWRLPAVNNYEIVPML